MRNFQCIVIEALEFFIIVFFLEYRIYANTDSFQSTTFGPLRNQTPLCEEFTAEDVYINGSGPDALKGPRTKPDEQFEVTYLYFIPLV